MTTVLRERAIIRRAALQAHLSRLSEQKRTGLDDARNWRHIARPDQLVAIDGDDPIVYYRGGRGSGKTRTGAETLADWIRTYPRGTWGVVAPTYPDARDKCIEGESGLLRALGPGLVLRWNRSLHELITTNGHRVMVDGAEEGAPHVQGENLRGGWADEVGLWKRTRWDVAWNEALAFAVRLEPARIVVTGTPKRGHPLVKQLVEDPSVRKVNMRTMDNAANLLPAALERLVKRYGGTRLGRQELEGEWAEDVDGALWNATQIDTLRVEETVPIIRVVIAVDPAATSGEDADDTGIVVAGLGSNGHGYVLADRSLHGSPHDWALASLGALDEYRGDRIVAEVNNGGEMVEHTIRTYRRNVPYKAVHASRGKRTRAEPVAALYEQGMVHHVGTFEELEGQMVTWTPEEAKSPDRMDALVWALTELMVDPEPVRGVIEYHTPVRIGAHV